MFLIKLWVIFAAICAVYPQNRQSFSGRCKNNMKLINDNFIYQEDKRAILAAHNRIREMVNRGDFYNQPRPNPKLNPLRWDNGLAALAKQVTDACKVELVTQTSTKYDCVAQNLYAISTYNLTETIDWEKTVQSWADKVRNFKYPKTFVNGYSARMYTQIIWADTTAVGCSAIQYQDDSNIESNDDRYVYLIICNYGPCGNLKDETPYTT